MTYELVLVAVGLLGGLFNAAGAGGGVLIVLALLAVGMPAQVAVATMQVSIPAGFLGAVIAVLAARGAGGAADVLGVRRDVRPILPGVLAAMAGTAVGVLLVSQLSGPAVRAAAPGLMVVTGVLLILQPHLPRVLAVRGTRVTAGNLVEEGDTGPLARPVALPVWLFLVSLYAGAWGGGAGVAVLLVLVVLTPWTWRQANAGKNGLCLAMSLMGAGVFITTGLANLSTVAVLVAAQLVGGVVGVRLADRLPENVLRGTVAASAVLGAVAMAAS